jgi:hypothetical protein
MSFIKIARSKSGAQTVQLAEKHHGKYRILRHIGSAHTAQELKRLKSVAIQLQQHPDQTSLFPPERPTVPSLRVTGHAYVCFEAVIRYYYERLGFIALGDGDGLLLDLVLMRIYEPCSKLRSLKLLDHVFHRHYPTTTAYRLLSSLEPHAPKEPDEQTLSTSIATESLPAISLSPSSSPSLPPEEQFPKPKEILLQKLHAAHMRYYGGALTVVLYDVTTLFFESARDGDEYKVPGYSKDGKHNDPQILVGLLTNMGGFPLGYETFAGKTFEGNTLLSALLNWQAQFPGSKLRVVADAGMLNKLNAKQLVSNGFDFIVGARMNSLDDDLTTKIIDTFYKTDTEPDQKTSPNTNVNASTNDDGSIGKLKNTGTDLGLNTDPNISPHHPSPSLLAIPEHSIQLADTSSDQSISSLHISAHPDTDSGNIQIQPAGISPDAPADKPKKAYESANEPVVDGTIETFVYTTTIKTKQKDSHAKTTTTSENYGYRFVVSYSAKRARKDLHTIERAVTKAKAIVNGKQTIKRRSPFVVIDEPSKTATSLNQAAIDRKKALAGLKGYITNLGTVEAPDEEIIAQYHELWHVEKSFRMSKHDLRARPIFHYKEDSIKAHLLIVVMALAVSKLIEKDSGESIQHVRDQLIQAVSYYQEDRLTHDQYVQHPELDELDLTPKLDNIVRRGMRKSKARGDLTILEV